jgi:hypothetical protein
VNARQPRKESSRMHPARPFRQIETLADIIAMTMQVRSREVTYDTDAWHIAGEAILLIDFDSSTECAIDVIQEVIHRHEKQMN